MLMEKVQILSPPRPAAVGSSAKVSKLVSIFGPAAPLGMPAAAVTTRIDDRPPAPARARGGGQAARCAGVVAGRDRHDPCPGHDGSPSGAGARARRAGVSGPGFVSPGHTSCRRRCRPRWSGWVSGDAENHHRQYGFRLQTVGVRATRGRQRADTIRYRAGHPNRFIADIPYTPTMADQII